jgi:hypothetical protein
MTSLFVSGMKSSTARFSSLAQLFGYLCSKNHAAARQSPPWAAFVITPIFETTVSDSAFRRASRNSTYSPDVWLSPFFSQANSVLVDAYSATRVDAIASGP